jgi:hypothetical protein
VSAWSDLAAAEPSRVKHLAATVSPYELIVLGRTLSATITAGTLVRKLDHVPAAVESGEAATLRSASDWFELQP